MKQVIGEILREFYEDGVPKDVKGRHLDFAKKSERFPILSEFGRFLTI